MLVSPMPPQMSLHPSRPPSTASSSLEDKDLSAASSSSTPHTTSASTSSYPTMAATLPPSASYPTHTPANMPATTHHHATTVSTRPKLTLQTSSLPRTFGSSSTGLSLSLAGGATASPTVRNTFKNAYDVTAPSSATTVSPRFSKAASPFTASNPYQLPLGVRSILRNSPLEPSSRRRSLSISATATGGARRVFFPAKKQVTYRQPLEEEIHTVRYTARHSDLTAEAGSAPRATAATSSDEESDSSSHLGPSDASTSEDDLDASTQVTVLPTRKKRKHLATEKQVRAVALMDGLEGEEEYGSNPTTPQTPCQARSKRRCEWRWTLGPLEHGPPQLSKDSPPAPMESPPSVELAISIPTPPAKRPVEDPCNSSDVSPGGSVSPSSSDRSCRTDDADCRLHVE